MIRGFGQGKYFVFYPLYLNVIKCPGLWFVEMGSINMGHKGVAHISEVSLSYTLGVLRYLTC